MFSQKTAVLHHLLLGKSITQKKAIEKFKAYRLGAIVYDLRKEGYPISTVLKPTANNRGKYAEYKLV